MSTENWWQVAFFTLKPGWQTKLRLTKETTPEIKTGFVLLLLFKEAEITLKLRYFPGFTVLVMWPTPGGLNFGLRAMCHQFPTFLLAFTERPPFLPTFTKWPHIFNKLLVTERPWHTFVTKRPLIFAFNVKQVTIFGKKMDFLKISTNLTKCWEIFDHFGPESPYFLMHFTERPHIFVWCHWKTPFFDTICHRKTPTSEVLGSLVLSYVSAPPPGANFEYSVFYI